MIRYDIRGFGRSALPTAENYDHSDDLRALLTHLGIDHAFILGLSRGGRIAINFAVMYPEVIDALLPADATLTEYQWMQESPAAPMRAYARQAGVQEAKPLWLNHPLFAPAREKPAVAARLAQMVEEYSGWHVVNDDRVRIPEPPVIQRLDTITAPTLVIVGERDLYDFHRIADILAQGVPGAKKVIIPGVGHMSNMEDPERFNEIVLEFLAEIERR